MTRACERDVREQRTNGNRSRRSALGQTSDREEQIHVSLDVCVIFRKTNICINADSKIHFHICLNVKAEKSWDLISVLYFNCQ